MIPEVAVSFHDTCLKEECVAGILAYCTTTPRHTVIFGPTCGHGVGPSLSRGWRVSLDWRASAHFRGLEQQRKPMLLLAFRGELLPLTVQPPALVELFQLPPRRR